jgi:hypothetical protein
MKAITAIYVANGGSIPNQLDNRKINYNTKAVPTITLNRIIVIVSSQLLIIKNEFGSSFLYRISSS